LKRIVIALAVVVIGAVALVALRVGTLEAERPPEIAAPVAGEAAPNSGRPTTCVYQGKTYETGARRLKICVGAVDDRPGSGFPPGVAMTGSDDR
jgi:hypothetical protein